MKASDNFFTDDQDLIFHVQNYPWLEIAKFMPHWKKEELPEIKDNALAILENIGGFIAKELAPHGLSLSEQTPSLVNGEVKQAPLIIKMTKDLAELGAMASYVSPEWGGMGFPLVMGHIMTQMLAQVDVSISNVFAYHVGGPKIMEQFHGSHDFSQLLPKFAAGHDLGAMALTEPQAGSDLSQIRTRGSQQADGSWLIKGQKIWITCGHAQHHFVLARTGKEQTGLKGLSLFYVPAVHNEKRNLEIGGLESKIGHHPVVTATINYNNSMGYLLGEKDHGFAEMLHVMNHARVATASLSLGTCQATYSTAEKYAQERETMGQPIARHPMIADYLSDMKTTIHGLRALLFKCLFHEDMEFRLRLALKTCPPEKKAELNKLLQHHYWQARLLTPLAKYFGSEESVRISRMAIQILGGVGYMKEYGLGRFHQDSLLLAIYEGTSQIQSLMVLKDRLKNIFRSPSQFVQEMAKVQYALISEIDPLQRKLAKMKSSYLQFAQTFILEALSGQMKNLAKSSFREFSTAWKTGWDHQKSLEFGLKHAERFTKVVSYLTIGEILCQNASQVSSKKAQDERREIAWQFLCLYEPRCRSVLNELKENPRLAPSSPSLLKPFAASLPFRRGSREREEAL